MYELARGVLETAAGINRGPMILSVTHPAPYLMVAIYFMLTYFDQWRVGGAAFARRPRAFLRLDMVDVTGQTTAREHVAHCGHHARSRYTRELSDRTLDERPA